MKKHNIYIIIIFLYYSCGNISSEEVVIDPAPTIVYKIMPIGDSRVDGSQTIQGHQSYRYELWKNLIKNDWDFDFTGPRLDPTNYPIHQGLGFDPDHAGFGGATSVRILNELDETIQESDGIPDIVLLGIGGNDLNADTPSTPDQVIDNINMIVDSLQEKNNYITIVIEQIAPARTDHMDAGRWELLREFNDKIALLVIEQTSETSTVINVDMADGWQDAFMYDGVHYNATGAKEVADRYYNVLQELFN